MPTVHPYRFLRGVDTILYIAPLVYGDRNEPQVRYKADACIASDIQISKKSQDFQLYDPPTIEDLSAGKGYVDSVSTGLTWRFSFQGFLITNTTRTGLDPNFQVIFDAARKLEDEIYVWHEKFLKDTGTDLIYRQFSGACKVMDYQEPSQSDGPGQVSCSFMGVGPLYHKIIRIPRA